MGELETESSPEGNPITKHTSSEKTNTIIKLEVFNKITTKDNRKANPVFGALPGKLKVIRK